MGRSTKSRRSVWVVVPVVLVLVLGALNLAFESLGQESTATTGSAGSAAPSTSSTPGAGTDADGTVGEDAGSATGAEPAASGDALTLLETLPVKGRAPKTGYDRVEGFGTAWFDTDRNGCDTRNDILARDLSDIDRPAGCRVLGGTLDDPYTDTSIAFVRGNGTSQEVQIDHVVALMDAWQTGAQALSPEQRRALANDPLNLLAVQGRANSQKGAADAASWLPPAKGYRCEYVARQVAVKAAYALWVTPAEHAAIAGILAGCPGQTVPR